MIQLVLVKNSKYINCVQNMIIVTILFFMKHKLFLYLLKNV